MSRKNLRGNQVSDETDSEQTTLALYESAVVDEVAEREQNLQPTVEQEIQGKVDTNHPDAKTSGLTLEAEERLEAREREIRRTRERRERNIELNREAQTRLVAREGCIERHREFRKRAASVTPWEDPDRGDPRAELSQEQLGTVNKQAVRLDDELDGWSRAAISRRLAERVADGAGVLGAVVGTKEELQEAPGQVVPIGRLEDVNRQSVSIEGRVETLWNPSHPSIAQVGLVADESGQTRVTVWKQSRQPWMEEGERVRIHGASRNWYEGRVSVAVTGWSTVLFPDRGRWWE
ncbi:DNA-binding protein [Halostella sp. JP-L12]|uniref:DNA-binding protein n=1 Tax=Halostella TaxID=1843185 RepID=UPI000EF7C08B|nr:DNA-binding protein [Halostella sp. JP-L12]NHN48001.1 DNA-binding protein [Halostella sp. JP-L12]